MPVIQLEKPTETCASLDGSGYNMATVLMDGEIMWYIDWLVVTLEPVSELLFSSISTETISIFTVEGTTG